MFSIHHYLPPSVGSFSEVEEKYLLLSKVKSTHDSQGVKVFSLYMKAGNIVKLPGGEGDTLACLTPPRRFARKNVVERKRGSSGFSFTGPRGGFEQPFDSAHQRCFLEDIKTFFRD